MFLQDAMPGTELASFLWRKMGFQGTPPNSADGSLSATWGLLFLGLIGAFLLGLLIFVCFKRRRQTSAGVTPVGEVEFGNAAP
ncbi:hypothetical protein DY000_02057434 [Brassica cretica]|uniref:Legume lectin domain-containing protein n=1 Tax=Brassica cretica TaxID=69181 RepID=A0ABQ7A4G3_BRACR|nr:hypothetical protein DY000_02057434 [Brassica cretica]